MGIENDAAKAAAASTSASTEAGKDVFKAKSLQQILNGSGNDSGDTPRGSGSIFGGAKGTRQFAGRLEAGSAAYARDLGSHADYLERVSAIRRGEAEFGQGLTERDRVHKHVIDHRSKDLDKERNTKKPATRSSSSSSSTSGKKPTAAAVARQSKAASSYVTSSKTKLSPEAKEQNAAARSYGGRAKK